MSLWKWKSIKRDLKRWVKYHPIFSGMTFLSLVMFLLIAIPGPGLIFMWLGIVAFCIGAVALIPEDVKWRRQSHAEEIADRVAELAELIIAAEQEQAAQLARERAAIIASNNALLAQIDTSKPNRIMYRCNRRIIRNRL